MGHRVRINPRAVIGRFWGIKIMLEKGTEGIYYSSMNRGRRPYTTDGPLYEWLVQIGDGSQRRGRIALRDALAASSIYDQKDPDRIDKAEQNVKRAIRRGVLPAIWFLVAKSIDADVSEALFNIGVPSEEEAQRAA